MQSQARTVDITHAVREMPPHDGSWDLVGPAAKGEEFCTAGADDPARAA